MTFDSDPSEDRSSYPCPSCEQGCVTLDKSAGVWSCDKCDWENVWTGE